jgi:hypothetical protein
MRDDDLEMETPGVDPPPAETSRAGSGDAGAGPHLILRSEGAGTMLSVHAPDADDTPRGIVAFQARTEEGGRVAVPLTLDQVRDLRGFLTQLLDDDA